MLLNPVKAGKQEPGVVHRNYYYTYFRLHIKFKDIKKYYYFCRL